MCHYPTGVPIQVVLSCPKCGFLHLDTGEWADRPHRSHLCLQEGCGHVWRPAAYPTVGVRDPEPARDARTDPVRGDVLALGETHVLVWDAGKAGQRWVEFHVLEKATRRQLITLDEWVRWAKKGAGGKTLRVVMRGVRVHPVQTQSSGPLHG